MRHAKPAVMRSSGRPCEGGAPAARPMPLSSRLSAIVAGALLTAGIAGAYAGVMVVDLVAGLLSDGLIVIAWVWAAGLLGSVLLRTLGVDGPRALRWLTGAGLGLGCLSIAALLLGLAGWLNRVTSAALPLAGAALWIIPQWRRGALWPRAESAWADVQRWLKEPAGWEWLLLLAVPFLAVVIVGASVMPGFLWRPFDPHPYDVMEYHLQVPREWYEAGRIHALRHNVYNFFPGNMEMQSLLLMHIRGGPWKAMYLAQYMSAACTILAIGTVYAAVRSIGGSGRGGVLAACAAAAVPWITMLGTVAYVESMLMLFATLALAWTIRAMDAEKGRWRMMLLAGILAGFACGVKYTAVPVVLMLLPGVYFIVVMVRQRGAIAPTLAACATSFLAGLLVFSPWLARNTAWTGNPVFPLEMKLLGQGHFDDDQVDRFDRAHRVRDVDSSVPARLNLAWRGLIDWQYAWFFMPLAVAALVLLARRPAGQFLLLAFALQLVFWIFFTHLMPRFAVLLVPLGAVAMGLAFGGRLFPAGVAGVLVTAFAGFSSLHGVFAPHLSGPTAFLIRWTDMEALTPDLQQLRSADSKLALIGDAQPFFHRFPAGHIAYRTVFDIRFPTGKRSVDAWLGRDVAELRKEYILYVHPAELRRLSSTYHGVTPLESDWQAYLRGLYAPTQPIVVEGAGAQAHPDNAPMLFPRKP